jgi:hypothetical protein
MKLMTDIYERLDIEIWEEKQSIIKEKLHDHEINILAYF